MSNNSYLRGTGVALITPFLKNSEIDFASLEKIIDHCIKGGVNYLVSMGTTGESVTLSPEERNEIIRFTIKICKDQIPVIAGLAGNNTAELLKEFIQFDYTGISGILTSSPAYNKPSQEGIYQHYMALAEVSQADIIIYNVPGRTSSNILPETILRLAHASEKFSAVKEASADLTQATKIIKDKPSHFLVLSGDDPTALASIGIGGDGVISVIANIFPEAFSKLIRLALDGNFHDAIKLNNHLFDIHKWLYVEGNPTGVKAAAHILDLCENELRLPLVPMSKMNYEKLLLEMQKIQ
ncbi:MAG: 4-hydroxy-tetrahydrodipicolinate synthase [Bacteroidota bacterium]|nr:4-hydroxy-tetrahydrodipicolinate synthase [Bacteroidota bacterium]